MRLSLNMAELPAPACPRITEELAGLQDEVPAEDFESIRQLAETELGAPLEERFEHFES